MNLPSMMRLMVEEMADGHWRWFENQTPPGVGVLKSPIKKFGGSILKKLFDMAILLPACRPQLTEILE